MTENMRELLLGEFKNLGQEGFAMTHYELHEAVPQVSVEMWKAFITDPLISAWMTEENQILRQAKFNTLIKDLGGYNAKSTGAGQQLSALTKVVENTPKKSGPAYIYTYVPLNAEQEKAENTQKLEEDIFLRKPEEFTQTIQEEPTNDIF